MCSNQILCFLLMFWGEVMLFFVLGNQCPSIALEARCKRFKAHVRLVQSLFALSLLSFWL